MIKLVFLMKKKDLLRFYTDYIEAANHCQISYTTIRAVHTIAGVAYLSEAISLRFEKLTNGKLSTYAFEHDMGNKRRKNYKNGRYTIEGYIKTRRDMKYQRQLARERKALHSKKKQIL